MPKTIDDLVNICEMDTLPCIPVIADYFGLQNCNENSIPIILGIYQKMLKPKPFGFGIDKNKIGVMGFSAGGHLASTAATHFEKSYIENVQNTNLRPDFQILVYPVITMQDALTHGGSRDALIGKNPLQEDKDLFSNELQVKANTPITWLTHAADDKVVDVDNSISYFEQLRKNKLWLVFFYVAKC